MVQRQESTREAPRPPAPKWTYKVINPVLAWVLRSPLHAPLSRVLMLLTFTGRRSGRPYTTPVGYHVDGAHLLVFTHSPWWRNLRGGAPVELRLRGRDVPGWAVATTDVEVILPRVRAIVDRVGARNARRIGLNLPPDHPVTDDELRDAIRGQGLVMIQIEPGRHGPR